LTDSEGRQIENPKLYEKTLKKIKILQKNLSRKKKGSKNYEKARIKLARAHEKLKNQRDDLQTLKILHQMIFICVENLNIKNMVRNRRLSKKIQDASWGKFLRHARLQS
jgi:putative transposase